MTTNRSLFCRPRGGITDTLAQIAKCYHYAARYHRTLIIDTTYSGLQDDFGTYLELSQTAGALKAVTVIDHALMRRVGRLSLAPSCLTRTPLARYAERKGYRWARWLPSWASEQRTERLSYKTRWRDDGYFEKWSFKKLTFDFNQDHPEQLLLHHQGGTLTDPPQMVALLTQLSFTPAVQAELVARISPLVKEPYHALHIRHTDYRSDFIPLCKEIATLRPVRRILLCTDSSDAFDQAAALLQPHTVLSTQSARSLDGTPIHSHQRALSGQQRYHANLDAFTDLIAISLAQEIDAAQIINIKDNTTPPLSGPPLSGFVVLARLIHRNRNSLSQLIPAALTPPPA